MNISGYHRQLHGQICRGIKQLSTQMPMICSFRYRWQLACLLSGCYGKGTYLVLVAGHLSAGNSVRMSHMSQTNCTMSCKERWALSVIVTSVELNLRLMLRLTSIPHCSVTVSTVHLPNRINSPVGLFIPLFSLYLCVVLFTTCVSFCTN